MSAPKSLKFRIIIAQLSIVIFLFSVYTVWHKHKLEFETNRQNELFLVLISDLIWQQFSLTKSYELSENFIQNLQYKTEAEFTYFVTKSSVSKSDKNYYIETNNDNSSILISTTKQNILHPSKSAVSLHVNLRHPLFKEPYQNHLDHDLTLAAMVMIFTIIFYSFYIYRIFTPLQDLKLEIIDKNIENPEKILSHAPLEFNFLVQKINSMFNAISSEQNKRANLVIFFLHQTKNMTSTLIYSLLILRHTNNPEKQKQIFQSLETQGTNLIEILNKFLRYEQMRIIEFRPEWVDLNNSIEKMIDQFRNFSSETIFEFNSELASHSTYCDIFLLNQAIENIMKNALIHGGKKLTKICITTSQSEDSIIIDVGNNGEKIKPKLLNRLFTPGANQQHRENGTGIGTSIIKLVAEMHSGNINVTSENDWTIFRIVFPATQKHKNITKK